MNLFFGNIILDGFALLTEEDSAHCIRVLRMKSGHEVFFTDGNGNFYTGTISDPDPKKCQIRIAETKQEYGKKNYSLHIAIAPTKNIDRLEWFLEKATEIGIDEITPVICQRSERRVLKTERLNKVLLSAMKQSLKTYLPKLNEPVALDKFISENTTEHKYICLMNAEDHLKNKLISSENSLVLIGPEGDFTETEIALTRQHNFIPVSLGKSRLRTETAGIVAASIVSLLNQ
ncbi:MAG: 16S rRNA (uracil(1498)-N(3))-methyltransferase [Bacteroidetes bacterium]|nr:16S rRNA (uracil(1498)-N(3))-methyltransferase [Bacteroidota bacterium]